MKTKVFLLTLSLILLFQYNLSAVGREDSLEEQHLQFLKEEFKDFRSYVQQEREAHQKFLEWTFAICSSGLVFFVGLAAFLGFQSLKEVKRKLEADFENRVKLLVSAELLATEKRLEALQRLIQHEEKWYDARLRFVGSSGVLSSFKRNELSFFGGERPNFTLGPLQEQEDWKNYDVIVYYLEMNDLKEDPGLQDLLERLDGQNVPMVIYTHGQWLASNGTTKAAIDKYQFHTMANNIITLLNNTNDAFKLKIKI